VACGGTTLNIGTGGGTLTLGGFNLTIPANYTFLAHAAGVLTNNGTGTLSGAGRSTPSAHHILSVSHGDSTAASLCAATIMTGRAQRRKDAIGERHSQCSIDGQWD